MPMFNPVVPSGLTIGSTAIASGTSGRLFYDAAGVAGEMSGTSWDDTNRALTLTGATVTTSNPLLNLSQTWNAGAVAFTGIKANITNTASAAGSLLMDLQVGGASQFTVRKDGALAMNYLVAISAGVSFYTGSQIGGGFNASGIQTYGTHIFYNSAGSFSAAITADAANILALRNGTAAQTFNLYNTYTDASNYERGEFSWLNNVLTIRNNAAGTGGPRNMRIGPAGNATLYISANGGDIVQVNGSGFMFSTDNTSDIGASGGNRPRRIYAGGFIVTQSTTVASLTAAATAGAGARSFVTDATATTFLSTVAGGGANKVPVVSDGVNWLIG